MRMSTVVALGIMGALLSRARASTAGALPERRAAMLVPRSDHEALRATVYAVFPRAEGRWGAVHVVDRTCSTSRAVVARLLERRASAEADELVIVVAEEGAIDRADMELVHAGVRVRVVARDRASELVPTAWPVLIVARPDGTLAYVGGHGEPLSIAARHRAAPRSVIPRSVIARSVIARSVSAAPREVVFVDDAITRELVTNGSTTRWAPVVGCAELASRVAVAQTARTMQ